MLDMTDELELVDKICYMSEILRSSGGVKQVSRTRIRCAWGEFNDHQF